MRDDDDGGGGGGGGSNCKAHVWGEGMELPAVLWYQSNSCIGWFDISVVVVVVTNWAIKRCMCRES